MATLRFTSKHLFNLNQHVLQRTLTSQSRAAQKARTEFKQQQQGIFTVPNVLTMSRIASAPVFGYFLYNGMHNQALACFAFAATTDLLDGLLARKLKQESEVGRLLDPIADKIFLSTCLISMYSANLMPLYIVRGLILRDFLILSAGAWVRYNGFSKPPGWRKFFDFKNHPSLGFDPTLTSKWCTALQCLLIPVHLTTAHLVGIPNLDLAIWGLQMSVALTATFSLSQYFIRLFESPNHRRSPRPK